MIEHAKRVFWLGKMVDGGKITNRKNLERVAHAQGRPEEELLAIPECPEEVHHIFGWFCEMRGGEHLTFQEVKAWVDLTGHQPTPAEVGVLMQLDRELASAMKN